MSKKSYIIAGPTAGGKSAFAHELARQTDGTVINADSVQIYKGLENISSSPFADGKTPTGDVPYELYSVRDVENRINAADYLALAREKFEYCKTPIFVGGTGYYLKALIHGISPIPAASEANRKLARAMVAADFENAKGLTNGAFSDPQRTARALEVLLETGKQITEWRQLPQTGKLEPTPMKILIDPPKEAVDQNIRNRLQKMLDRGGLAEIEKYIDYPDRAIGIAEIGKYLRGEVLLEAALDEWERSTRQYAKRQRTWFRTQYDPDVIIPHIPTHKDLENLLNAK